MNAAGMALATTLLVFTAAHGTKPHDYRRLALSPDDVKNISLICHQRFLRRAALEACLKRQTDALEKAKQSEIDAREAEQKTLREIGGTR